MTKPKRSRKKDRERATNAAERLLLYSYRHIPSKHDRRAILTLLSSLGVGRLGPGSDRQTADGVLRSLGVRI